MKIIGTFQIIGGKPCIVGKPETWKEGFDDWPLEERDVITVRLAVQSLHAHVPSNLMMQGRLRTTNEDGEEAYTVESGDYEHGNISVELQDGTPITLHRREPARDYFPGDQLL